MYRYLLNHEVDTRIISTVQMGKLRLKRGTVGGVSTSSNMGLTPEPQS